MSNRQIVVTLKGDPALEIEVDFNSNLFSGSEIRAIQNKILLSYRRMMHQIVYAAKRDENEFTTISV